MIYNKSFLSGNFDAFSTLMSQQIPQALQNIKGVVLPGIDNFLNQMLQGYNTIEKTSVNVGLDNEKNTIKGLKLDLVYTVGDFKVNDAPQDAVDADVRTLKENLVFEGLTLIDLKIDINNGQLTIQYEVPFGENNDQTGNPAQL